MKKILVLSLGLCALAACKSPAGESRLHDAANYEEVSLTPEETTAFIAIFNRTQVPLEGTVACQISKATVSYKSCGFSPTSWSLASSKGSQILTDDEVGQVMPLFNRLPLKLQSDSACSGQSLEVSMRVCGNTPANWVARYEAK